MARNTDPAFPLSRRQAFFSLFGLGAGLSSLGCAGGRDFCLLGYSSQPNYDPGIKTVYVPIFKTSVLETTPYRGMEFKLTREVIKQIELKTRMKVIQDADAADTELQGTIVSLRKFLNNRTPLNEQRNTDLVLGVEIVWHDLRPGHEGKILTNPQKRTAGDAEIFDPFAPPPPENPDKPQPVLITDSGRVIEELGESSTTGLDMAIRGVSVKIVSAMERPW